VQIYVIFGCPTLRHCVASLSFYTRWQHRAAILDIELEMVIVNVINVYNYDGSAKSDPRAKSGPQVLSIRPTAARQF